MTVLRIKKSDNFVSIHKGALENPNLSFKAKGLWTYCMSRTNDWQFHISHLATVSKDGEDAIYSAIKELEEEGYIKKVQRNEKGRFGPVDYEVYEESQLKKFLPQRDFPDAGFPHAGNPPLVNNDILVNIEKESNAAEQLSDFLLKKLKSIKPDFTKGVSPSWLREFAKLLKKRTPEQLQKLMDWVFEDSFWSGVVHSPSALLKNIDKIEMQMQKKTQPSSLEALLVKVKERTSARRDIFFGKDAVSFSGGATQIEIPYNAHGFRDQIVKRLQLMGIDVSNL